MAGKPVDHPFAGLARGDAAHPRLLAGFEFAERRRDRAGGFLAKLVAANEVDVVHPLAPDFRGDFFWDVAAAAEILGRRKLHHGEPVERGIVVCRGRLIRRRHRRKAKLLAGLRAQFGRIHQAIAADPHLVVHLRRQVWNHKAALLVRDNDLGEFGRQFGGLSDNPNARFGAARPAHYTADAVIIDGCGCLLRSGGR